MTETRYRITWGDTDAGGLVYFPRLFHLFVVGLNDHVGGEHPMDRLRREGHVLPVVEAEASFEAPLRAGDDVVIETSVPTAGESSFTPEFEIRRGDMVAATGSATFVLVDGEFEPTPLPDWLAAGL